MGDQIYVELFNPNQQVGLVRAKFSLALIGKDGSVVAVLGSEGVPGSVVSTIYQLPPNGTYGYTDFMSSKHAKISSLELTIPASQWRSWSEVSPPTVDIVSPKLKSSFGDPGVTGRIKINGGTGTHNVYVMGFVERGTQFVIAGATVDCQEVGVTQAFQAQAYSALPHGRLLKIVAYTTTVEGVPGYDGADQPPGC